MKKTLRPSNDSNQLTFAVTSIELKPNAEMIGGVISDSIIVTVGQYNLQDLLCQMIEDYGEDKLIEIITSL